MKFINYSVIKFSVFLVSGILTAHFFPLHNFFILKYLWIGLALLGIFWFVARKQLMQHSYFGITTYIVFFGMGYANYQIQLPDFQPSHYSHFVTENSSEKSEASFSLLQLKISEVLKPDRYYEKFIAEVIATETFSSNGKILVTLPKDSVRNGIFPDDILLIYGTIKSIQIPLNPNQFDYSKYMKTLGVYHSVQISESTIFEKSIGKTTIKGAALKFRDKLIKKLEKTPLQLDERAILQALVLGQKKDISKEIYSDYAAAGAIHILAVSGLHVGIVYFLLLQLLKPIRNIKYGIHLQMVIIIICLWCFALITGLSPSVTRAVTMFSFFGFAQTLNRPTNTVNTLFLSFFVLLVLNPLWLFHVGFQLSYLAVLSILVIHPKLFRLYKPKFYIDRLLWSVFTVSIAAQIGIVPLSLYYFHQFPGLFFITNLVVLPFLSIVLAWGILLVILAAFNLLPDVVAIVFNYTIEKLNAFINWVATQENFLFEEITFSGSNLLAFYFLLVAFTLLWYRFNYHRILLVLSSFGIVIISFFYERQQTASEQILIFQKSRQTLVGYKQGKELRIFRRNSTIVHKNSYPLKAYRVGMGNTKYSEENIPSIFQFREQRYLIIDSLGIYPKHSNIDIVVLIESPKINLERLIDSLKPRQIIADGSNYKSYVARWQASCELKKLPFYHTGTKGAFIAE